MPDSLGMVGTVVNEIAALLDGPELVRPTQIVPLHSQEIRLNDVSFSYNDDGDNAIKHINLIIKPGTVTALVGPSGSGKSTITKIDRRLFGMWVRGPLLLMEKTCGRFRKSNCPIRLLMSHRTIIYSMIPSGRTSAWVAFLHLTQRLRQLQKAAGCDAFIRSLENGYNTNVGGAGGHLSGGERQRIAIARAMLKNAPIVILDEATAYIDPENEAVVQMAVSKLVAGKTLIIIAHRLSTITDSDQNCCYERRCHLRHRYPR